tara:strand:- start:6 stop:494 length:489 start_codon:yes stop_codon:yes gene_type:complete
MKITQQELKQIILEEVQCALKEQVPNGYKDSAPGEPQDRREVGAGRTRGEEAAMQPLRNTQAWAKQLTPVKYRQLLEDVKRMATEAERQSRESGQRGWIKCAGIFSFKGAEMAMAIVQNYALRAMKGKVTAERADDFEDTFQNCEVLLEPVLDSGYPGVHTA